MFESLKENSTINVANNLTYQNNFKLLKNILQFRLYVEIKNIIQ